MSKYAKFQKDGFVVEEDGHFVVNYLPIIEGFEAHGVKKTPKLAPYQWVEVIHRNGDRDYGPVEVFAWGIMKCHPNDREDYMRHVRQGIGERKPVFDHIDLEITHFRTVETPPPSWRAGTAFPRSSAA